MTVRKVRDRGPPLLAMEVWGEAEQWEEGKQRKKPGFKRKLRLWGLRGMVPQSGSGTQGGQLGRRIRPRCRASSGAEPVAREAAKMIGDFRQGLKSNPASWIASVLQRRRALFLGVQGHELPTGIRGTLLVTLDGRDLQGRRIWP